MLDKLKAAMFGAAALVGIAGSAQAALQLRAEVSTDGGLTFASIGSVVDNGVGDLNLALGGMAANLAGLGVQFTINTAIGNPATPFPGFSTTFNATTDPGITARILRVEYTQTGVPAGAGTNLLSDFSVGALLGGQGITTSSFIDTNDVLYGTSTLLFSHTFAGSGSQQSANAFVDTGTYSQTIRSDINFFNAASGVIQTVNGTAQLTAIPEPATLVLLGAGLLGLAAVRRSRRQD